MNAEPLHPSNHNLVGLTPEEQARYSIESAFEGPRSRWTDLKAAVEKCPEAVDNQTIAEKATTLIAQLQALRARIRDAHADAKEPWLAAGRTVDNARTAFDSEVASALNDVTARLEDYQLRELKRIEAERAAQRQKEAEDPEPSWAPRMDNSRAAVRVRSVEGASAHLTTEVTVEIVDVLKIPLRFLNRPKVIAALISEITPDARKGDEIEGIKVHHGAKTRVTK